MRIALIAHDRMKGRMVELAAKYRDFLAVQQLWATATTGRLITKELGLTITTLLSGPLGGDAQISALVAVGGIDLVVFLRDPHTAQPHEPDITALMRICDVHEVALATNPGSAEQILASLAGQPE